MSYVNWIREQVGRQKIFLVFASVVIRDKDGRVLLHRRTDFEWWGIPGGVMEGDEDIQTCARREVEEETGLEIGSLELVGVYSHPDYDVVYPNGDQVQQFTICFTGVATGGRMQPDGVETTHQAFFTIAESNELAVPSWYRRMINDAVSLDGYPALEAAYSSGRLRSQMGVIGQLERRPGVPIAVSVVGVVVDDGRVLVTRDSSDRGWRLPAAYCRLGENGTGTAVRAVQEQTGYAYRPRNLLGVYSQPGLVVPGLDEGLHHVGVVVCGEVVERPPGRTTTGTVEMVEPQLLLAQAEGESIPLYEQIITQILEDEGVGKAYFVC